MLRDFCVKIDISSPDKKITVLKDIGCVFTLGDITVITLGNIFDNQGRLLNAQAILKTYNRMKENITSRLDGVYGLVIIDKKRNKAFIFHSRIPGGNYIYYFSDGTDIFISSSLKNILINHNDYEWTLDEQSVEEFIDNGFVPSNRTLLFNIFKNSGGKYTVLNLKNGFTSEKKGVYLKANPGRKASVNEFSASFSHAVEDCVKESCAIEAGYDCGSALLLSSMDKCSAKGMTSSRNANAFCLVPKNRINEIENINMLCRSFSNISPYVKPMSFDILSILPQIVRITEGAVFDRNSIYRYEFANMLGNSSCKSIVLSDGADEIFCSDTFNRRGFAMKQVRYSFDCFKAKFTGKSPLPPRDTYADASCVKLAQNDIFLNCCGISVFRPFYTNKVLDIAKKVSMNRGIALSFKAKCVEKNISGDAVKFIKDTIKDVELMDLFKSESDKNDIARIAKSSSFYRQFRRQFNSKNLLVEYLLRIIYIELFRRIFLNKNQSFLTAEKLNYSTKNFFPRLFPRENNRS